MMWCLVGLVWVSSGKVVVVVNNWWWFEEIMGGLFFVCESGYLFLVQFVDDVGCCGGDQVEVIRQFDVFVLVVFFYV